MRSLNEPVAAEIEDYIANTSDRCKCITVDGVSRKAQGNHLSPCGSSWRAIQEQIIRMPPEIRNIIMAILFEDSFGPRKVYPDTEFEVTNVFLALDKDLYAKYSDIYWSKNTWVVCKGPVNDKMRFMVQKPLNHSTMQFSLQIPNDAALNIRSLEISFSLDDIADPSRYDLPVSWDARSDEIIKSKALTAMQEIETRLQQIWRHKFDRLVFLHLDYLELDLRDTYSPTGDYLGCAVVQGLRPFWHGLPSDFKILGPSESLTKQIREIFQRNNCTRRCCT